MRLGRSRYLENTAMSTRERWIVYPLLFLTLGITMRDKIVRSAPGVPEEIVAKRIRCGELRTENLSCEQQTRCGELRVDGPASCGRLQSALVQCIEVQTIAPGNKASVTIGTDPKSGFGIIAMLTPRGLRVLGEPGPKKNGGPSPTTPVTPNPPRKEKAAPEAK
jgi:hypothetical protein